MGNRVWNVCMVGPGWVAGAYLACFRKRDDVRVTHVVGATKQEAAAFVAANGLDAQAHGDLAEALADRAIDIVGVYTPHNLHAGQAIAAARAGKHVIIEKPICLNREELAALRRAVREAGVKTITGFVLRWNPMVQMIRRAVAEGVIGEILHAEADYLHGKIGKSYTKPWHTRRATAGTGLLLAGCHAVDALRYVVGRPAREVFAYSTSRTDVFDYPSTEVLLVRFDDGVVGKVASNLECRMPYVFNLEVFGTKGAYRNNQLACDLLEGQTGFATIPTIQPDSADVVHHPFEGEVAHFLECLKRDERPMPDVEDAAETMEICFAAEESARTGRPVPISV